MPYLLDGNNLVGLVLRTSRPSADDRAALIAEISSRLRQTRARATVFFDGPAGGQAATLGALTVRGAGRESADDAILREVSRSRAPGEVIVVTADRELARRCRDAGASVCSPVAFFERFGRRRGPGRAATEKPPAVDVEEWMRYFGDERNRE
jgi:YacP-like NYN domain